MYIYMNLSGTSVAGRAYVSWYADPLKYLHIYTYICINVYVHIYISIHIYIYTNVYLYTTSPELPSRGAHKSLGNIYIYIYLFIYL